MYVGTFWAPKWRVETLKNSAPDHSTTLPPMLSGVCKAPVKSSNLISSSCCFSQTLLAEHSRLIQCLATVDSKDGSSKMSFSTATLHRALQKTSSNDHLDVFNHGHSNSSLDQALNESGTWPSMASNLSEEDPSSMASLRCSRRMTRSRSLDDMLDVDSRHRRVLKKTTTLKRRIGSSKFYTEHGTCLQNAVNKGTSI